MANSIRLPVLTRFAISEYQLYPGPSGDGFAADILTGVNLVIGINGLGKTTLLNALFRVLSGPRDWKSRPFDKRAGSTPSALGKWKTKEFFTRRVPDHAEHATISATILLGDTTIDITRRLNDLAIKSLIVNGKPRPNHEDTYEKIIREAAGVPDFADFYLILRYLVFFLEDRQLVVWDKTAQADILRVLFYSPAESEETRKQFDLVQELDSQYRNKRGPYNIADRELKASRVALEAEPRLKEEFTLLLTEIEAYEDRERDAVLRGEALDTEYVRRLRALEQKRVELEEEVRKYERLEQRYLGAVFPDLHEVAEYVFAHVSSGGGCLVCGNRDADIPARLLAFRETDQCPVCDSPPELQERVIPRKQVEDRRLDNAFAVVREFRQSIASQADELKILETERAKASRALLTLRETVQNKREEATRLQQQLPKDEQQILALQAFVDLLDKELKRILRDRDVADTKFREVQKVGEARVRERAEQIKRRFDEFAGIFLADSCTLEYTLDSRKIGSESERQSFPHFAVKLASGVFHHTTQLRVDAHEVSESQKEFIDLAFRMALIAVACEAGPAMMVLETPEASLDAVFILRAGFLLARFAGANGGNGYRIIASSNLNRTEMIPALFGYYRTEDRDALPGGTPPPLVPLEERPRRVIDLLEIAEQNTALLEHGDSYRRKRDEALYPERFAAAPRKGKKK